MADNNSNELQRLATVPRNDGKEELRISLDEYTPDNGRTSQYVSIRLWYRGDHGDFLPSRKGVTIRKSEIQSVGVALRQALDAMNEPSSTGRAQPTTPSARAVGDARDTEGLF